MTIYLGRIFNEVDTPNSSGPEAKPQISVSANGPCTVISASYIPIRSSAVTIPSEPDRRAACGHGLPSPAITSAGQPERLAEQRKSRPCLGYPRHYQSSIAFLWSRNSLNDKLDRPNESGTYLRGDFSPSTTISGLQRSLDNRVSVALPLPLKGEKNLRDA
ncbi:hypothetical protein BJV78DRAFT_1154592 [Lactifluus subvellereus]|nr:hypothetical protein BJV78DRAFT_1154592 [Lactifluus subvellereus]